MQRNSNINMPGLKNVRITKIEEQVVLHVELPIVIHSCPYCGEKTKKVHNDRIQKIKYLKWFERITILMYRKCRYECVHCHKRFDEKYSFANRYQRFSRKWNQMVSVRSVKGKPLRKWRNYRGLLVRLLYVDSINWLRRRWNPSKNCHPPAIAAIDEHKGDTNEGTYQLIIVNAKTHEPTDILPNRRKITIKHH